jgi:hypothetical protein
MSQYFFIDKTTGTFADTLLAIGFAALLAECLDRQTNGGDYSIMLHDRGSYHELVVTPVVDLDTIAPLIVRHPLLLLRAIQTPKNVDQLPPDLPEPIDYENEKQKVNDFYDGLKKGVPADDLDKPRHWDIYRAINPAALPGYNALVLNWWTVRKAQPMIVRLLFDLFSTTPNDYDAALAAWKKLEKAPGWSINGLATSQQLYNPDQGKGQNRIKADGLSIGNLKSFWLAEYLKAAGFYEAAVTRLVKGAKDRKTFVIAPRELDFVENRAVMNKFIDTITSEASTRFDILAALRYTQTLLEHFSQDDNLLTRLLGGSLKKRLVAGFDTAFYKDLGNAVATMNVSFIALPGWVEVQSHGDVNTYKALIAELIGVTRQLDESHSDAFNLLQHLRDFVSGDDLVAFFRFTNAFPAYYMGMRERGRYAVQISTTFIERLMMSTDRRLSPILGSDGFQSIAYAIRQSTVTAQYRKKQGERKYDVRYGLGQELARKARYPDEFIAALSDFLHKYNAENAQVMETRNGPYRRSIKTSDIDAIVSLIDEYGSETVANLLIAYGYARVPREDVPEEELEQEQES